MQTQYIDLHSHTTASDGSDSPEELIIKASKLRISAIAITDHDTVEGIIPAQNQAKQVNIECIPGCEIAVHDMGEEIHILGLWVPYKNPSLLSVFELERQRRLKRNQKMIDRLCSVGVKISLEDVLAEAGGPAIGRPHIAKALIKAGYVPDITTAFKNYLAKGKTAFIPRELSTPEEGISMLRSFGATVVYAHPCLSSGMTATRLDKLLIKYKEYGLEGIEAYHTRHSPAAITLCLELAKKHNLLVSGGSDYHGEERKDAYLGEYSSGKKFSASILEKIKDYRKEKGLPV